VTGMSNQIVAGIHLTVSPNSCCAWVRTHACRQADFRSANVYPAKKPTPKVLEHVAHELNSRLNAHVSSSCRHEPHAEPHNYENLMLSPTTMIQPHSNPEPHHTAYH
jgi:hypothetical protein